MRHYFGYIVQQLSVLFLKKFIKFVEINRVNFHLVNIINVITNLIVSAILVSGHLQSDDWDSVPPRLCSWIMYPILAASEPSADQSSRSRGEKLDQYQ